MPPCRQVTDGGLRSLFFKPISLPIYTCDLTITFFEELLTYFHVQSLNANKTSTSESVPTNTHRVNESFTAHIIRRAMFCHGSTTD